MLASTATVFLLRVFQTPRRLKAVAFPCTYPGTKFPARRQHATPASPRLRTFPASTRPMHPYARTLRKHPLYPD